MTEISRDGNTQVTPLRNTPAPSPALDTVAQQVQRASPVEPRVQPSALERARVTLNAEEDPLKQATALVEEAIPEFEQTSNTRLRIDRDEETGRFIYSNVDNESGEVIRRFPPESILRYLAQIRDPQGLVLDDTI